MQHDQSLLDHSEPGGYRDKGAGYDHEHFEEYRQDPPMAPGSEWKVTGWKAGVESLTPPASEQPIRPTMPNLHATLTITDDNSDQLVYVNVTGIPEIVQQAITYAMDAAKDHTER